jgi:hypothetical protein
MPGSVIRRIAGIEIERDVACIEDAKTNVSFGGSDFFRTELHVLELVALHQDFVEHTGKLQLAALKHDRGMTKATSGAMRSLAAARRKLPAPRPC